MLVILGESGSGKTTLAKGLTGDGSRFKRIVTYTTRPMRDGEVDHVDYHFIDEDTFHKLENKGFFVESMNYRGWYYGIAKKDCLEENAVAILTPHGLRTMRKLGIPTISVYLKVNRPARLIKMLERGDDPEEAYRRNLTDVGEFDGVQDEVDFVLDNGSFDCSPEEVLSTALRLITPASKVMPGQIDIFVEGT